MFQSLPSVWAIIVAAATGMIPAGLVRAQTTDYGTLREIFGQPVTTSVAGRAQLASDVAAIMSIIGQEEIRRSGARSLPDLLLRVVGADVLGWGTSGRDVGLRGTNQPGNSQLLVLLNGRQVYLDHYGLADWSAIPVELGEILQIEVVRGPQAALFGYNAVSGVVNIITANPLYDQAGHAEVSVGDDRDRAVSVAQSFKPFPWLGLRFSAGADDRQEYVDNTASGDVDEIVDRRRRSLSLDALAQFSPVVQAGLAASLTDLRHYIWEARRFGQNVDYEVSSLQGRIKANTEAGLLGLSLYVNRLDVQASQPSLDDGSGGLSLVPDPQLTQDDGIDTVNTVYVAQADWTARLGQSLSSRLAVEYRYNGLESTPFDGGTVYYRNYAASAVVDWEIGDGVAVTFAGRVDSLHLGRRGAIIPPFENAQYDRTITAGSYNAGAVWKPDSVTTLRLIGGLARQSPTMLELGLLQRLVLPPTPITVTLSGNPLLRQPELESFELALDREVPDLGGRLHFGVYRQVTDDLKQLPRVNADEFEALLTFENTGGSEGWGAEAWIELAGESLSGRLGYTWTDIDLRPSEALLEDEFFNFNDAVPRHAVTANLTWTLAPVTVDLLAKFTSPRDAVVALRPLPPGVDTGELDFDLKRVGTRLTVNGAVTWAINDRLDLAVAGSNIQQEKTRLSYAAPQERRLWVTLRARL